MTGMRTVVLDRRVHLLPGGKVLAARQHTSDPAPLDLYHREGRPGHITQTHERQGGNIGMEHVLVEFDAVLLDLQQRIGQERKPSGPLE